MAVPSPDSDMEMLYADVKSVRSTVLLSESALRNLDQNRIELRGNNSINEIVIEYVADEALSSNPSVHIYASDALKSYIYYKIIERRSDVPFNEKARARSEYFNDRRIANSRLKSFTKEELLKTIRKNFKQSPKR